jgi:hypothetical protein
VLLKSAPLQASASGVREKVKMYYVLALVHADTKSKKHGTAVFRSHGHS